MEPRAGERPQGIAAGTPEAATEAVADSVSAATKGWERRILPLAGGLAALGLGWVAEEIVRSRNTTPLSLLLYIIAIVLFAASARPLPARTYDLPAEPELDSPARKRLLPPGSILVAGAVFSLVSCAGALFLIMGELTSVPAVWLWLLSMVVLMAAGIFASRGQGWVARWGSEVWPKSRKWAFAAIGAIALIMLVASAARLLNLDQVPYGINADEGDRAALSIQIARGQDTQSLFDNGWYWISVLYFWLLAQVMKVAGISYVGARVFGALASILSVGVVTWIGVRNFGLRTGLLAGVLLSLLGVSLQFARETSEAGPTATLWALSVACFLEAARRGRYWAWTSAGLAGGLSIYFYPTGRLWAVLAVLVCGYLLINGLGKKRLQIFVGSALAGLASLVAVAPFLVRATVLGRIEMLTQRAQETSIFTAGNTTRLPYVEPGWNIAQLLSAQLAHTTGIFNQFTDQSGFWPTDQPIMPVVLSLLTLLGLGWCCLRVRDARFFILAVWFWVGIIGTIVTVETPDLERMATAIPVLALFPALALDNLAGRLEWLFAGEAWRGWAQRRAGVRRATVWAASGAAAIVALALAVGQYQNYFVRYAATDRWPQPSHLGWAVRDEGVDTWVFTVGREYHMVNSGWVRLLAPNTPRGGLIAPGNDLPISIPADRNMAFLLFPNQAAYLPYIQSLYPGGALAQHTNPTEGLMFTTYRIPQAMWTAQQGVTLRMPGGKTQRVANLGEVPAGWTTFPAQLSWTANLEAPQYWNYSFKLGPGPASLKIDGKEVASEDANTANSQATVGLVRGNHFIELSAGVQSARGAQVQWAQASLDTLDNGSPAWSNIPTYVLTPAQSGPQGLLATVQAQGFPEQKRIDGTLASCRAAGEGLEGNQATAINWQGTLDAPASGVYSMTLFVEGQATLKIDGKPIISADKPLDEPLGGTIQLTQGKHLVSLDYSFGSVSGCVEWTWLPPGGQKSIVPPSVLSPPEQAGVSDPVPQKQLGSVDQQPKDDPIETIP